MAASPSRVAAVLAQRAGVRKAKPGDSLRVAPDRLLLDGESGLSVASAWHESGVKGVAAFGPRLLLVDSGRFGRRDRKGLVEFGESHRATIAVDPVTAGWPSTVAVEEGLVGCNDVVMALDSEAGALGGLGVVVLRATPAEMGIAMRKRMTEVTVPDSRRVEVTGRLPRWCGPFDLAMTIVESLGGAAMARGRVIELFGETTASMKVDDRMALCGALARCGVASLVLPDEATRVWLAARRDADGNDDGVPQDPGAGQPAEVTVNARKTALACVRGNAADGERYDPCEAGGPKVTQVLIGGRLSELREAALALSERPIHRGLHLAILPASRRVLVQLVEEGLAAQLLRAGASIFPPGMPAPTAPRREARITTVPTGGADLLCGAAVAGASAALGCLSDPEGMRQAIRRAASLR